MTEYTTGYIGWDAPGLASGIVSYNGRQYVIEVVSVDFAGHIGLSYIKFAGPPQALAGESFDIDASLFLGLGISFSSSGGPAVARANVGAGLGIGFSTTTVTPLEPTGVEGGLSGSGTFEESEPQSGAPSSMPELPVGHVSSVRLPGQIGTVRQGEEISTLEYLSETGAFQDYPWTSHAPFPTPEVTPATPVVAPGLPAQPSPTPAPDFGFAPVDPAPAPIFDPISLNPAATPTPPSAPPASAPPLPSPESQAPATPGGSKGTGGSKQKTGALSDFLSSFFSGWGGTSGSGGGSYGSSNSGGGGSDYLRKVKIGWAL